MPGQRRRADIVVPIYRNLSITRDCLESVLAHTGEALGQLILVNDCSPEPELTAWLRELRQREPRVRLLENEVNLGFVGTANRGLALRERDVVLLNSDTRVTPGWLDELLEVAESNDRICAVVPLSNNATLCSVPAFCEERRAEEVDWAALRLADTGIPRSTEVPTGVGFCLLLKHVVLNLVGGLDPAFGRGYNEENDWAMRAQRLGFTVHRANKAFVYHVGSVSFGTERNELERINAAELSARHPHYVPQVGAFCGTTDALVAAHAVRHRMGDREVCIDLSYLRGVRFNGTSTYALALVRHLASQGRFRVSVMTSDVEDSGFFASMGIPVVTPGQPLHRFQVMHRPAQVMNAQELAVLAGAPCHLIISYQDLIGYRVPHVHPSFEEFQRYRALSVASLAAAQAVIAISEHNRGELLREFHLPPEKVHLVHQGVDVEGFAQRQPGNRDVLERHGVRGPFFLCAGTDYAHKNLALALEGYSLLRARLSGRERVPELVLIGFSTGSRGSLYTRERWPAGVRYLGALPAGQVRVFFQEALALLFPTA
ncbi:MAG TPA: glycosyltransferase, partial [Archangium sp.]